MLDSCEQLYATLDYLEKAVAEGDYVLAKEKDLYFKKQLDEIIATDIAVESLDELLKILNFYGKIIGDVEFKKKDTHRKLIQFSKNQKKLQKYKHG